MKIGRWKPASATIIKGPEASYDVSANQIFRITCFFENHYRIASNAFRYKDPNGQWNALSNANLATDYPGSTFDVDQTTSQANGEHTLIFRAIDISGGAPTELKYFCRDINDNVDPADTDTEQLYFDFNYVS